jgi:hypothetical protein
MKRSTSRILQVSTALLLGTIASLTNPAAARAMTPPPDPWSLHALVIGACRTPGSPAQHTTRMIAPEPGVSPSRAKSCR